MSRRYAFPAPQKNELDAVSLPNGTEMGSPHNHNGWAVWFLPVIVKGTDEKAPAHASTVLNAARQGRLERIELAA